jgi:hypothetical protein
LLVDRIRTQFRNERQLRYQRSLVEFFDDHGKFIGDNVFETTFKMRDGDAPLVYEVSGPYDAVSNQYATIARVYAAGQLKFIYDIKPGILQRTAAMVWLYLETLHHTLGRVLFVGAGKLAQHTATYLKHFSPALDAMDYQSRSGHSDGFESLLAGLGIQAKYVEAPDLSVYDTIILATNTSRCILHEGNCAELRPGSLTVSLCTTSQTGEISSEVYARPGVNLFLDYELTKSFTVDMRGANGLGYLDKATFLRDLLTGQATVDIQTRANIVRLTGTPIQNVAVIDMMLDDELTAP